MPDRLILMIGGTRGTGLLIAQLLLKQGAPVRILARDPQRAATIFGAEAQIVPGDITKKETLPAAVVGASHIVFTAGSRSGRPVREAHIRATEYDGVLNTLAAAHDVGFAKRFLYMTSSGVNSRSFWTGILNLAKGNTLVWRRRAETAIRASGLDYTVIRCGILLNRPAGRRAIRLTQDDLPLSPRYHIARGDVAEAFVAALDHPRTRRTTFEIVWGKGPRGPRGPRHESWSQLLDQLKPDGEVRQHTRDRGA